MNTGVISVRYARALLKSAEAQGQKDAVYQDMHQLAQSFIEVKGLQKAIDNPMLAQDKKETLLLAACGAAPSELTKTFVSVVLKEGRENLIQFMANAYVTLYRDDKHVISGRLITAVQCAPETEAKMRKLVESRTEKGATVEFRTEVNPDIIGGFILEYDTYRLDASVQSQLKNILKELK